MDGDSSGTARAGRRPLLRQYLLAAVWFGSAMACASWLFADAPAVAAPRPPDLLDPGVFGTVIVLLALSAFFSCTEIAFFSLNKLQLRSMAGSDHALDRMVARLMLHPGDLLASILMGNCIVNVLMGIVLATPAEQFFEVRLGLPAPAAFAGTVALTAGVLVFFGDLLPKVIGVRQPAAIARGLAPAVWAANAAMTPLRFGVLAFIGAIFRITRFSEVRPAPFMTNEEFKALVSEGEAWSVIENEERQMIKGILEFGDMTVREILVPRPDVTALPEGATVRQALALYREEACARMPVYAEDLDHIVGILYAKDLLRKVPRGELDEPVQPLVRKPHYIPETMTIADFMEMAQRTRTHMAIVVDEYGGTEGLATLHDALSVVIGDLGDDDDEDEYCFDLGGGEFRVDGAFTLHDFEQLTGVDVPDEEHTTVAGFLMAQSEKVLEKGDEIVYQGVVFRVEKMDGRRVVMVRIQVPQPAAREALP